MASIKVVDLQSTRLAGFRAFPFPHSRICHLVPESRTSSYWQANQPTTPTPYCHSLSLLSSHTAAYFNILLCLSFRLLFQGQLIHGIAKVSQMRTFFALLFQFPPSFLCSHFLRIPLFFLFHPWEDMEEWCYTQNELFMKIPPTYTDWFFLADFCLSCFSLNPNTHIYYDFLDMKKVTQSFKIYWTLLLCGRNFILLF